MKKLFYLFIFVTVLLVNTEAKDIKGKIIYPNDTLDVIFKIPTYSITGEILYSRLISKIFYYDSNGKKVKISPDDVVEIRFLHMNEEIRMLSVRDAHDFGDNFSKAENIFLKLIVDGQLKLFEYYFSDTNLSGNSYTADSYLLKKKNGDLWWPEQWAFRKDMVTYLSDCPELSKKIEEKEFQKSDLVAIVEFYNTHCVK